MQIQNYPGIYSYSTTVVYKDAADRSGHEKVIVHYYTSLEDFFRHGTVRGIKSSVGNNITDTICQAEVSATRHRSRWGRYWFSDQKYCNVLNCKQHDDGKTKAHVVCDENGNHYTSDRLVGLYRKWYYTRPKRRYLFVHAGYKPGCWSGFRTLSTLQERKWAHAWDDVEDAPKVRAARQGKNLPDSWDDYQRHAEKSWKHQSKRKHQWK